MTYEESDASVGQVDLAHVIGDAPAAVLLVDLASQQVLHANEVARQLAPGLDLPVPIDTWSDLAVLRDLDGVPLSDTDHPLSRLSRREAVPGQAVSAERRSDLGAERDTLWTVGVPMEGAPGLDDHALVVFLAIRERGATEAVEALRDGVALAAELSDGSGPDGQPFYQRAVLATGLSFTVADATSPDLELVWVNPAFTATTGYGFEESVGHNCRFLQGPGTSPASTARMREALLSGEAITETLLNYRKDGLAFWNQVTMSPISDGSGTVTHFVGVQTDVSGRIEADQARDQALQAERRARADAERVQTRLQLLTDAAERLTTQLNPDEVRQRLVGLLIPRLADLGAVYHLDAGGKVIDWAVRHTDADQEGRAVEVLADLPAAATTGGPLRSLAEGRQARLVGLDGPAGADHDDLGLRERLERLGMTSGIVAALPGRHGPADLIVLTRRDDRAGFDDADVDLVMDLGRRAGVLLENARLFQDQRHIAETLQRSLLPHVSALRGVEVASRYLPSQGGAEVGGDFFDAFQDDDGTVTLIVGDVIGHDIYAAATMGHLKGMISAVAHDASLSAAEVLQRVDELIVMQRVNTLATVLIARLRPGGEGPEWTIDWSSAGHPPLVVREPDGQAYPLQAPAGRHTMLGVDDHTSPPSEMRVGGTVRVPSGTLVLGYTDGLVERRREPFDQSLERLVDTLAAADGAPELVCDRLVADLVPHDTPAQRDDDVALLLLRVDGAE